MSVRTERVGDQIAKEVSLIIDRELKDPAIGFVTVTGAKVTPDLRYADVYVSVLGDQQKREASMAGLDRARGFVRSLIGKRVRLRYVPEIRFKLDDSLIRAEKVDRLLEELDDE